MLSEDPRETVAGMTQAVLDIRRATAWLAARDEVDDDRLGITGISLGGVMSPLAASGEPRLITWRSSWAGAISRSLVGEPTDRARKFREKWLAEGETRESFRDVVSKIDAGDARASFKRPAGTDDRGQKR